jgi:ferrous iron transport protein B
MNVPMDAAIDLAPVLAPTVALVGNPNCGKTALFNALTGSRQKVANYPGVTVEKKIGRLSTPGGRSIQLVDLPGTYSLRARSPDEEITRDAVLGKLRNETAPDLIVCVGDASNLRLALRLALELKHVGRPVVLALNMMDIARKRGIEIDMTRLAAELGVPVVSSVAVRRGGTDALLAELDRILAQLPAASVSDWKAPGAGELRSAQSEADRVLRVAVRAPGTPDGTTTRADAIVLHPVGGIVILLAILFVMFQAVFAWAKPLMEAISDAFTFVGAFVGTLPLPELLRSFLKDGVIAGVGSVIVFLPQIVILFFFILLLEDLGYMARAAFLMDKIMGGAGLHGRAFIPLLSSFACAIPGIMATRVIDDRRDRLTTILVAPLMTCSARIPVYTLIISAFIPDREVWGFVGLQGLVMFCLYAAGIVGALTVSFVMKRLLWRTSAGEPFMLELPDYKIPQAKSLALGVWARATAFLKRAGRRDRSGDQLQPGRDAGSPDRAAHRAARFQLADQRGADPRHGRARSSGRGAGHDLRNRRRRRGHPADRPGAGGPVEPRHGAGAARLVRVRAAMRVHAGRHPPRDRRLEVDVDHLRLHARAGLHRRPDRLPDRGRARRRLGRPRIRSLSSGSAP